MITNFLEKHSVILQKMSKNLKSRDLENMLDKLPTVEFVRNSVISKRSEENEKLQIEDGIDRVIQIGDNEMEEGIMKRSVTSEVSSLMLISKIFSVFQIHTQVGKLYNCLLC